MNMTKFLAAGVALVSTAALAEGIASANVVGYSESKLRSGAKMLAAQFVNVGANENLDLQDLKPTGSGIYNRVKIQTLNQFGQTINTYVWSEGPELDVPETTDCWADPNGVAKTTGVSFGPAQGLWVYGGDESQGLQSAGQVNVKDVAVTLCAGAKAIGNPYPTSIDLQEIVPEGDDIYNRVKIQTLNEFGQTVDTYIWSEGPELDNPETKDCWADPNGVAKINGVKFDGGEGLWVYGASDKQTITFPAPEL